MYFFYFQKNKLLETMNSLEKSLSDQLKQHTTEIDVLRKEKIDVTKESNQLKQDYEKSQTLCKEFEMKSNIAQESITNLKADLKNKVLYNIFVVLQIFLFIKGCRNRLLSLLQ